MNIRRIAGGARVRGNGDERVQKGWKGQCSHEEGSSSNLNKLLLKGEGSSRGAMGSWQRG